MPKKVSKKADAENLNVGREGATDIWDRVSTTNIAHTKEVSFGRKFTAIDAHSQILEMTREFGPCGQGWGYENVFSEIYFPDGRALAIADICLWWAGKYRVNKFGPVRGSAMLVSTDAKGKAKNPDTDAYKKAMTDGLTKAISHLGFNADVFLGKFDDSKYVEKLKAVQRKDRGLIEEDQVQTLTAMIEESGADLPAFLNYCKVESLGEIPKDWYGRAVVALDAKIKRGNKLKMREAMGVDTIAGPGGVIDV